jgi:hypothetical protein
MPQSLVHVLVHLVFSTKDRGPFLNPAFDRIYMPISPRSRAMPAANATAWAAFPITSIGDRVVADDHNRRFR